MTVAENIGFSLRLARTKKEKIDEEVAKKVEALSNSLPAVNWNDIVKFAGRSLPQGTWLKSLTIDEESQATLTGASFTNDAIYEYLNYKN